jgi:hypothetical protein
MATLTPSTTIIDEGLFLIAARIALARTTSRAGARHSISRGKTQLRAELARSNLAVFLFARQMKINKILV